MLEARSFFLSGKSILGGDSLASEDVRLGVSRFARVDALLFSYRVYRLTKMGT
jgi:hypothetical protein